MNTHNYVGRLINFNWNKNNLTLAYLKINTSIIKRYKWFNPRTLSTLREQSMSSYFL